MSFVRPTDIFVSPRMVVLDRFPFPPSQNAIYQAIKGRFKKSDLLKDYERDVEGWAMLNRFGLDRARTAMLTWTRVGVVAYCGYKDEAIFTKAGSLRKDDVSNRLKALHDKLANCIGIDDSLFVYSSAEKIRVAWGEERHCLIVIRPHDLRTMTEIRRSIAERFPPFAEMKRHDV